MVKGIIMFKKAIAILLLFTLTLSPLFSAAELSYKPYGEDEFPIWTMKIRRAESIFFGSLVLTLPITSLVWSLCENGGLIQPITKPMDKFLCQLGVASGLSLCISAADWIIGEVSSDS